MAGISMWQLLVILAIVVLLFGTKKLKGMGSDIGGAVKGFKKAMSEDEAKAVEQKKADAEQDADFDKTIQNKEQEKS